MSTGTVFIINCASHIDISLQTQRDCDKTLSD
jgi:hypothetical protein